MEYGAALQWVCLLSLLELPMPTVNMVIMVCSMELVAIF
jgi:hypothetical protein